MNYTRLHYASIGAFSVLWLSVVIPMIKKILGLEVVIFPVPPITHFEKIWFLLVTILFVTSLVVKGISEFKKPCLQPRTKKKFAPLILVFLISFPLAFGYVFEQSLQSVSQTILDLGGVVMDQNFDDVLPGEDPPGWAEESGEWYAIDDGGNIVYYNNDDGDAEALSISTTGNTSWTDYSFLVDLKFDTGPTNKPDRGALLVYRYTNGNDYYFLALREALDELEVYKHGVGGVGHLAGSTSCTLEADIWYSVNITIRSNNVWISIDDTYYFNDLDMQGSHSNGSVGIGTEYYKVMFDNILVELRD